MINDVNAPLSHKIASQSPSAPANQAKFQKEAATTVIDGSLRPTRWAEMKPGIADAKASTVARQPVKVDPTTRPAQVFRKEPDMPKPASHASIKVNY